MNQQTEPNMPAHPTEIRVGDNGEIVGPQTANNGGVAIGLTKREHFAAMAMQGQLSGMDCNVNFTISQLDCIAKDSVLIADYLINALNNPS